MTQKLLVFMWEKSLGNEIFALNLCSSTKCSGPDSAQNAKFRPIFRSYRCCFTTQSSVRNFPEFSASVYDDFPAWILHPSSGVFSGWIRRESAGINVTSGRIRQNPMTGINNLANSPRCLLFSHTAIQLLENPTQLISKCERIQNWSWSISIAFNRLTSDIICIAQYSTVVREKVTYRMHLFYLG